MLNQRSDTYLGNINVKRDGVQHNFTEEEVKAAREKMQSGDAAVPF